jgi:hypothetical protein
MVEEDGHMKQCNWILRLPLAKRIESYAVNIDNFIYKYGQT